MTDAQDEKVVYRGKDLIRETFRKFDISLMLEEEPSPQEEGRELAGVVVEAMRQRLKAALRGKP